MATLKEQLLDKIARKEMRVGVVGLGYVGLPLAVEKAKAGFKTIGFDVNSEKVRLVNEGHNYIGDVVDSDLKQIVESGMLSATTDFEKIATADFVAICVPTPLDIHQEPDISYVESSTRAVAPHIHRGSVIVLESTTYPGTTEELLKPILEEASGLKCGEDFYLGFSPERVDPGNLIYKTKNTPKVVGAIGKDATEVIAAMYRAVLDSDVFEASSPAIAEMEKILENTYRNINIGLVNELAQLCDRMGIDVWEVIAAARDEINANRPAAEEVPSCPVCGAELAEHAKFCANCGAKVEEPSPQVVEAEVVPSVCPQCGAELEPKARFCIQCGAKVETGPAPEESAE